MCSLMNPLPVSRFNWSDGKLNSSNLIELSGQITEKFDEEFRILYAQSQPISARGPQSVRGSGVFEHLSIKHSAACSPLVSREKPAEPVHLTSTPSRKPQTLREPSSPSTGQTSPVSDSSTIDGGTMEQKLIQEEVLAATANYRPLAERHATKDAADPAAASCHVSTQTGRSVTDGGTQTDAQHLDPTAVAKTSRQYRSPRQAQAHHANPDTSLKDALHELSKERRSHYSAIRSKLEHIVTSLTERRELVDITNVTQGISRQRFHKDTNPGPPAESGGMGTWPRARCVH